MICFACALQLRTSFGSCNVHELGIVLGRDGHYRRVNLNSVEMKVFFNSMRTRGLITRLCSIKYIIFKNISSDKLEVWYPKPVINECFAVLLDAQLQIIVGNLLL